MSTSSYLASFGITMAQAHAFVIASMGQPGTIHAVASQYGVTNEMLGEIAAEPGAPAYSADDVKGFFAQHGIGAMDLDAAPLVPSDMARMGGSLMAYDVSAGALSVDSLRLHAIAQVGDGAYARAFEPSQYAGGMNGTFTMMQTGLPMDVPATSEALQSLFFGSIIQFGHRLDATEATTIMGFITDHAAALKNDDPTVQSQLDQLVAAAAATPAAMPYFSDGQIAEAAVAAVVKVVGSMQGFHQSLFDNLLGGFGAITGMP